MELNLKKLLPLTGILCGCLMSFVNAHDTNSQHARSMNDNSQMNEITPNAGPRVSNGADVFITADFIWWTAHQDGMGYAFTNFGNGSATPSPTSTGSIGRGSVRHVADDWSPGFKVGIGLNLGHDGWDLMAEYTWLHTSNSSNTKNADPETSRLFPTWVIANEAMNTFNENTRAAITSAFANWCLHFNVINLELARNHYISQYLTLRPHVGLKGAWINQDYNVKYFSDVSESTSFNLRMRNDQDYWGIGIRTGLDTAWYFMKNFCMYGDFAIAAMWSHFEVDRRDSRQNIATVTVPAKINIINTENDFHTIKPVVEFGLGLRYDWWFSDDDYHFGIQAGWEEQMWVNHNNLFTPYDEANHGDLVTQGLTVKARFDF